MAQELELKILTDENGFRECLSLLREDTAGAEDRYVQVNYYFDTPDLALSRAHSMLRVRRKKNRLYLQYKNKRRRVDDALLCDEMEAFLTEFPRSVNPSRYFEGAPDLECRLLGDLVTHRTDFEFPGAIVSLDENIYLGKTDFEIEIEGEREAIAAVAARLPLTGDKTGDGKFSRFVKAYQNYYGD